MAKAHNDGDLTHTIMSMNQAKRMVERGECLYLPAGTDVEPMGEDQKIISVRIKNHDPDIGYICTGK